MQSFFLALQRKSMQNKDAKKKTMAYGTEASRREILDGEDERRTKVFLAWNCLLQVSRKGFALILMFLCSHSSRQAKENGSNGMVSTRPDSDIMRNRKPTAFNSPLVCILSCVMLL